MRTPHDRHTVQHLARSGVLLLGIILVADLVVPHKPHFAALGTSFGTWPLFHPLLGFASTLALVALAKTLGLLLSRKEAYYATD